MNKKDILLRELKDGGMIIPTPPATTGVLNMTDEISPPYLLQNLATPPPTTLNNIATLLSNVDYAKNIGVSQMNNISGIQRALSGNAFITTLSNYHTVAVATRRTFVAGSVIGIRLYIADQIISKTSEYYTKTDSDARYPTKDDADGRYYTKDVTYTRTQTDAVVSGVNRNLADNYALKTSVYTKTEIDNFINPIQDTIGNVYTKSEVYMKSEVDTLIGQTNTDLTANYYTKTDSDNNYYTKTQVYTKNEVDVEITTINTNLGNIYTKTESDNNYYGKNEVYRKQEIDSEFTTINTNLGNIYTKTESDDRYYRKSDVDDAFSGVATRFDATDTTITGIEGTLNTIQDNISDLNGRCDVLNDNFITLSNTLSTEIATISNSLDTRFALYYTSAQTDALINSQTATINTMDTNINTINTTLTNDINTINTTLTNVYTKTEVDDLLTNAAMTDASFETQLLRVLNDMFFGKTYSSTDRLLRLSDLAGDSSGGFNNSDVQTNIETLPLAQFKHLPDPAVLGSFTATAAGGGSKKSSRSPKITIKRSKTVKN